MANVNKKIRNATVNKQGNITFKSILEKTCFNTLIEAGFNPLYEPKKHVVFPSFKPITPFKISFSPSRRAILSRNF